MKIAVVGAGFTGLSAALRLSGSGHRVTLFEKEAISGGMASGFRDASWKWPLEHYYHHIFKSDRELLHLSAVVGQPVNFRKPVSSTLIGNQIYQIDNPVSLLNFPLINIFSRIRVGLVILYLKLTPFWKPLEQISAEKFLQSSMGKAAWEILWKPLFAKKFGRYYHHVPASWFWARIKKRSPSLGYPRGGFQTLADKVVGKVKKSGGRFIFATKVQSINKTGQIFEVMAGGKQYAFDKVIFTGVVGDFIRITKNLPKTYKRSLARLKGIGAYNLILSLKHRFLENGEYWLNANDTTIPFLSIVEHTNFVSGKNYGNNSIVYIGKYAEAASADFKKTKAELSKQYTPFLSQINPSFSRSWINKSFLYKTPLAQPLIGLNYSKHLSALKTPLEGLYLAGIEQIYPWDRGVNYAVELGNNVAELIG